MTCTRIYDFISGTSAELPAPPCATRRGAADSRIDILRANPSAVALFRRYQRVLTRRRGRRRATATANA